MRIIGCIIVVVCCFTNLSAQEDSFIDEKYLEDQLFLSMTYNILKNKPASISQNGLSGGITFGFIKDIPLNSERNVGFGLGLGYGYNAYLQNLKVSSENQNTLFEQAQNYDINRLRIHSLELPIEFRWRTSTPVKYKFWRIYGGVKLSYLFSVKTTYTDEIGTKSTRNISELNKLQYGFILAAGYGTWNLYVYYGLSSFFKDAEINGEKLDLSNFKIGLKFYML